MWDLRWKKYILYYGLYGLLWYIMVFKSDKQEKLTYHTEEIIVNILIYILSDCWMYKHIIILHIWI